MIIFVTNYYVKVTSHNNVFTDAALANAALAHASFDLLVSSLFLKGSIKTLCWGIFLGYLVRGWQAPRWPIRGLKTYSKGLLRDL